MTIEYKDSKRNVLDTSATFEDDDFAGWTVQSRASVTDGVLFTPDSNYANAYITHSFKTYAIGEPDKFVFNWDWKFSGLKLPFIGITSEASAGASSTSNAGGYGNPTEGNKKILLKNNDQTMSLNFRSWKTGGSNFNEDASSSTATTTNGTMYYYQFIKDGYNISWKRYGSIADRTAQTNAQQTITTTWNAGSTTGGWTDTADLAYIVIGSYGNYQNVGFANAGSNYTYDFKFYSGVTTPPAKPTNVQDNSILVEKDTARRYWFESATPIEYETTFPSSSGWTLTNTSGTTWNVSSTKLNWRTDIARSGSGAIYDLGSLDSYSTWLLRFELTVDDSFGRNADTLAMFGIHDKSDLTTSINGGYSSSHAQVQIQCAFMDLQNNHRKFQAKIANSSSVGQDSSGFNNTLTRDVKYYIEIKKNSATSYTVGYSTNSDYTTGQVSATETITLSGLRYLHFEAWTQSATASYESWGVGWVENLKLYTDVTTTTPATWTMEPTFRDDFSTDNWDNMSSRINVNTTTEKLDFAMYRDGANDSAVYDLGAGNVSDTAWVLRWKMNFTAVYASGNGNRLWFGLSSLPQTTNQGTAQDSIMMYQNHDGTDCFSASYSNGTALPQTNTTNPDYATGTTYYCELKRTSSTTIESRMWTGGYDGTLLSNAEDSVSNSTIGSVTGLRYVKMSNIYASQGGSVITGTIDDLEFYNGVTTIN